MTFVAGDVDPAGLERKSPTEAADIDEITRGMLALQAQLAASAKRPLARGTHAKGICVRAEFEVFDVRRLSGDPAQAERLTRGIFAVPGVYPAIVRFANADGRHRRDRWPDVRAMSFSIEVPPGVVPGATRLDFSLNSATTFPINDAHAFAVTVRVLSAEGMRAKWKALRSLTWSEFRSLLRVMRLGRRQKKGGPRKPYQQLRYWSTVPFLHGGRDAIKYSAIPENNPARPLQAGPNVLQDEIVRHVNEDAQMSAFDFALQFLEPATMTHAGKTEDPSFWVENAAVEWNESESPFHVVARLRLLPKSVLPPAQAETFSIDVTEHSTPESRPIGSINRARWHAEAASRAARLAQPVVSSAWTPDRPLRRFAWRAIGIAALVFLAALGWALRPVTRDLPRADLLAYPSPPLGGNGLTAEERQQYLPPERGRRGLPDCVAARTRAGDHVARRYRHLSAVPREHRALRIPARPAGQVQPLRASGRRDGRLREDHRAADDGPELHGLPRRRAALQRSRVPDGRWAVDGLRQRLREGDRGRNRRHRWQPPAAAALSE